MSCIYCSVGKGSWWWVWWVLVRLLGFIPTVLKHWSEPVPRAQIDVWEPWVWTLRTSLTTTTEGGEGSVPVSDNCPKLLLKPYSFWVVGWELFDCTIKGASSGLVSEWVSEWVVGWELFNQASKCELSTYPQQSSLFFFLFVCYYLLTYFLTYTQIFTCVFLPTSSIQVIICSGVVDKLHLGTYYKIALKLLPNTKKV
jgi:hypothetical protein